MFGQSGLRHRSKMKTSFLRLIFNELCFNYSNFWLWFPAGQLQEWELWYPSPGTCCLDLRRSWSWRTIDHQGWATNCAWYHWNHAHLDLGSWFMGNTVCPSLGFSRVYPGRPLSLQVPDSWNWIWLTGLFTSPKLMSNLIPPITFLIGDKGSRYIPLVFLFVIEIAVFGSSDMWI